MWRGLKIKLCFIFIQVGYVFIHVSVKLETVMVCLLAKYNKNQIYHEQILTKLSEFNNVMFLYNWLILKSWSWLDLSWPTSKSAIENRLQQLCVYCGQSLWVPTDHKASCYSIPYDITHQDLSKKAMIPSFSSPF